MGCPAHSQRCGVGPVDGHRVELGDSIFGALPWLVIVWLLLVFPSGSYPGRAEQVTGSLIIGFGVIASGAFAVDPTPMEDTRLPSPLAIPSMGEAARVVAGDSGFLMVVGLVLAAVVLLVSRWRRSVGVERLQYRWLFMGSFAFLLIIALGNLGVLPEDGLVDWMWVLAGTAIPTSIGIAVLRYRLYEIDRLISRTVSYSWSLACWPRSSSVSWQRPARSSKRTAIWP